MPGRPYSVLSKGERNLLQLLDTDALVLHYENVYAGRFRWENGPEGMDLSWPERMIFRYGLLGEAEAFGSSQLAGGQIGLRGIYEQPLNWFPKCDGTTIPEGWMAPHEGPTVYELFAPRDEVLPLCELMASAWRCMQSNVLNMSQPVLVQGTVGAEINVKEAADAINGIKPMILTLDRSAVEAKALDLGAKDHTESIIKVINDIDCEILARFGIRSAGTEKASGVTAEETLSIAQELRLRLEQDLEKRRRFCEAVQDKLPGLRCVPAPGLMDPNNTDNSNKEEAAENADE